jgi:hypothetical protein
VSHSTMQARISYFYQDSSLPCFGNTRRIVYSGSSSRLLNPSAFPRARLSRKISGRPIAAGRLPTARPVPAVQFQSLPAHPGLPGNINCANGQIEPLTVLPDDVLIEHSASAICLPRSVQALDRIANVMKSYPARFDFEADSQLVRIAHDSFSGHPSLCWIHIPASVELSGQKCFAECPQLV